MIGVKLLQYHHHLTLAALDITVEEGEGGFSLFENEGLALVKKEEKTLLFEEFP